MQQLLPVISSTPACLPSPTAWNRCAPARPRVFTTSRPTDDAARLPISASGATATPSPGGAVTSEKALRRDEVTGTDSHPTLAAIAAAMEAVEPLP